MRTLILLSTASVFLVPAALGQMASAIHINVNVPRPLDEACYQLQKQAGVAISTEDIPYAFSGDIAETPSQRAANPRHSFIGPRGGQLVLDSNSPVNGINDVSHLVNELVGLSAANGFPGAYSVSFEHGAFFVTPTQMRNASGALVSVTSVLDTRITLPTQQRIAYKAIEAIFAQVTQNSGFKIGLGMGPAMMLTTVQTTIGATNEPARNVIGRLFSGLAPGIAPDGTAITLLSYRLRFDPEIKSYGMSISTVASTAPRPPVWVPKRPSTGPGPYANKKQ